MAKRVSLTVTYRRGKPMAAYFRLPRQREDRVATSQRIDDVLIIDRAEDGRPIGIEITDPTRFEPGRLSELLQSLGQPAIEREELGPLAAA